MTELRLGERVTLHGRVYEITGFTAMSVKPRLVFLKDVKTREHVTVNARDLSTPKLRAVRPGHLGATRDDT
jgi:hypothetical protein